MSTIKADAITASTGTNTNIAITGKGSGKVKLGDGNLLFPDADGSAGQLIKTDGSGNLAFTDGGGGSTYASAATTTSSGGTVFGSLPATANTFIISFYKAKFGGEMQMQIGDSGGVETSGYSMFTGRLQGGTSENHGTTTSRFRGYSDANIAQTGFWLLQRAHAGEHTWVAWISATGADGLGTVFNQFGTGFKTLSGALTQISIPADGETWSDTNGRIAIHYF